MYAGAFVSWSQLDITFSICVLKRIGSSKFPSKFCCICYFSQGNEDLIIVHDALEYGDCHLSLAVSHSY